MYRSVVRQFRKLASTAIVAVLTLAVTMPAHAATILFQDDNFGTVDSDNLVIDNNDSNGGNIILQFGTTLAKTLLYSQSNSRFEVNASLDLGNNQLSTARVENVTGPSPGLPGGAGGLGAGGIGRIVHLSGTDAVAPGCTGPSCTTGMYSWDGTIWHSLQGTITTSNATKIITVGPTGRDYTTVAAGAAYCNTISGCEMWIDPGTYPVTTTVDLENVKLKGADTSLTKIAVSGSGVMQVRQTNFAELTIDIGVTTPLTGTIGMDVKYNAASTSSILFNKVDFIVASGKFGLGSSAGTPPITNVNLQNCSESAGTGSLVNVKVSSGLNTTSSTFTVIDLISTSALKLNDWPVTIVGGSNVVNTGNIITIPDRTILVSPGMSINNAISSLVASGGSGVVKLLVGTHTITAPIIVNSSDIEIVGEGPGTIVDAISTGWTGGTGGDVAAVQVGASNGTAPVNNVVVRNFKLRVQPDVHGIKINGGTENKVMDMIVQSTGIKDPGVSTHTAIVFTNSNTPIAAARRSTATRNIINRSDVTACTSGPIAGFCWVDGIHFDGDDSFGTQTFGYNGAGGGIHDSIISENIVNEARQTSYVFTGVTSSGIFSNRVRNIGFSTGSLGLVLRNSNDDSVINNTIETNNTTTVGITLYDNVDTTSVIGNTITANGTNFSIGIDIHDIGGGSLASTNNTVTGNQINGATTGINISANSTAASVSGNQIINTTTIINDAGAASKLETQHHRATVNPAVTDDIADGYGIGTIWVNTATNTAYILTDSTTGAAVWNAMGGGSVPTARHTFLANGTAEVWSNQPAATTEFDGASNRRLSVDLTNATQARFSANIVVSGTGGATLRVQYSTDGGGSWTNLDGGAGPTVPIASGRQATAFFNIDAAAQADVLLRVVGQGGNGFTDPSFITIDLEVK